MVSYIDEHRGRFGVEPICKELPIAPSTYYAHRARRRDPEGRSDRVQRDERLMPEIQRVWEENFRVYGARKVWLQLNREGIDVARCTVARLMKTLGIEGVGRGRRRPATTIPGSASDRPRDAVNRNFTVGRQTLVHHSDRAGLGGLVQQQAFASTERRPAARGEGKLVFSTTGRVG